MAIFAAKTCLRCSRVFTWYARGRLGPRANWPRRSGTGVADGRPGAESIEPLATSFDACPVRADAAAGAAMTSASAELVSVVDPDDRSDGRHAERSAGAARPEPSLPGSTRRRREGQPARDARRGARPASRSGPGETCGGYSGYSGDAAADNVSSPKPITPGGYSEDTQIRAGDTTADTRARESRC